MRKEIPDHLSWKCKHRETTCEFCSTKMPLTDLQVSRGHRFASFSWFLVIFVKNEVFKNFFQKHKDTVCPAFPVMCPNHCSFASLPRSEVLTQFFPDHSHPSGFSFSDRSDRSIY